MPDTPLNVFISCSMNRSREIAKSLKWLLRRVAPGAIYWIDDDIPGGELWRKVIDEELAGSSYGISVITPENRERPWLHFEAGAIAKAVGERTRLVPYLFDIADPEVVLSGPLKGYQGRHANKPDTLRLALEIAEAAGGPAEDVVKDNFAAHWQGFELHLREIKTQEPEAEIPVPPSQPELTAELLARLSRLDDKLEELRKDRVLRSPESDPTVSAIRLRRQQIIERLQKGINEGLREKGLDVKSYSVGIPSDPTLPGQARVLVQLRDPPDNFVGNYEMGLNWPGVLSVAEIPDVVKSVLTVVLSTVSPRNTAEQ